MAKDHYVPQFYLRNFQIPRKPGLVFLYRRGVPTREMSIKKVAQEEDYYDIKLNDSSVDKDDVDKLMFMSEDKGAPVIHKLLIAPSLNLSDDEYLHLTWFVALLGCRTPAVRETIASIHKGINSRNF